MLLYFYNLILNFHPPGSSGFERAEVLHYSRALPQGVHSASPVPHPSQDFRFLRHSKKNEKKKESNAFLPFIGLWVPLDPAPLFTGSHTKKRLLKMEGAL